MIALAIASFVMFVGLDAISDEDELGMLTKIEIRCLIVICIIVIGKGFLGLC